MSARRIINPVDTYVVKAGKISPPNLVRNTKHTHDIDKLTVLPHV